MPIEIQTVASKILQEQPPISAPKDLAHSEEEVTYIRECAEIQLKLYNLNKILKVGGVLAITGAGVGLALLGPLGLLIGVAVFAGTFLFKKYREFDLKLQLTGLTVQKEMRAVQNSDSAKKVGIPNSVIAEPTANPISQSNVIKPQESVAKPQESIESNSKSNKL